MPFHSILSHLLWDLSEWRYLFSSRYLQLCQWVDWTVVWRRYGQICIVTSHHSFWTILLCNVCMWELWDGRKVHTFLCTCLLCHYLVLYIASESTDDTILLTCVFSFCSKPSAPRVAKMEVPVQLQIPALVSVGGPEGHVKKVRTDLHSCVLQFLAVMTFAWTILACACVWI